MAIPIHFNHRTIQGYSDMRMLTVKEVNGVTIKNLKHMAETLRDLKEDLVTIAFYEENVETIVLDRKAIEAASEDILAENGIRKAASDDLAPIWEKK